jgi:RimJ/RimL family protein N-acetyltransferase
MLNEARALGLDRVLAVCAVDNGASVKTIERCGGVFEGIRDTQFGPVRRYWSELQRWGHVRASNRRARLTAGLTFTAPHPP